VIKHIHIAKNPSYPPYGVIVEYTDGRELWDGDCAASTEEQALAHAKEQHPRRKVLMWDNPKHYGTRKGA
jgi:1,2-phenylacetyl-CoA epoxidase PaaB subunit